MPVNESLTRFKDISFCAFISSDFLGVPSWNDTNSSPFSLAVASAYCLDRSTFFNVLVFIASKCCFNCCGT